MQFLTPTDALEGEAVEQAVSTEMDGVPTRVMRPEHLLAIALKTGRAKDNIRILQFLEQDVLDREVLKALLQRHCLSEKWQRFERQYLAKTYE